VRGSGPSHWNRYGLDLAVAHQWGLYVSTSRGKGSTGFEELALCSEPEVFLVRADGTLYGASVQTMAFARPLFKDMLDAIDFVIKLIIRLARPGRNW
jgi:hypothetical protein